MALTIVCRPPPELYSTTVMLRAVSPQQEGAGFHCQVGTFLF